MHSVHVLIFFFSFSHEACGVLALQPGIQHPGSPSLLCFWWDLTCVLLFLYVPALFPLVPRELYAFSMALSTFIMMGLDVFFPCCRAHPLCPFGSLDQWVQNLYYDWNHLTLFLQKLFLVPGYFQEHQSPVYQVFQWCATIQWAAPKNIQSTGQLCSLPMLVRLCSKSFKLGFSIQFESRNSRCTRWA